MKILFTKKNIEQEVKHKLSPTAQLDFVDVLRINHLKIAPFPLYNYSLIFTSVNGVQSFFENGFSPNEDFSKPSKYNKVYAVGKKTKKEIKKYGYGVYKVTRHASELLDFVIENSGKEKFIHFCGNLALDILDRKLPLQNIQYKKVIVYETELLYPKIDENHDAICFFSPSGVRSFAKLNSFDNKILFSIGETTENELKARTNSKIITSKESNLDDLLKLINLYISAQEI